MNLLNYCNLVFIDGHFELLSKISRIRKLKVSKKKELKVCLFGDQGKLLILLVKLECYSDIYGMH